MNLVRYRVNIDLAEFKQRNSDSKPSLFGRAADAMGGGVSRIRSTFSAASWPVKIVSGSAVGVVAVGLAPLELSVLTVAGMGVAIGCTASCVTSYLRPDTSNENHITSIRELDKYKSQSGQGPLLNGQYVEHPLKPRSLIKVDLFDRILEREQVSEIIRFARSIVALKSITINPRKGKAGKAFAGSVVEGVPLSGSASASWDNSTVLSATYDAPEKIPLSEPLIWQDTYQELFEAVQGSKGGGSIKLLLTHSGNFSASGDTAGVFKAQLAYLNERHLEVEMIFA